MSDLITADLVLLDENLGDTRFDVIAKLAEAVVKAGRATDFEQLYAAAEARESKTDTGIPGGMRFRTAASAAVTEPTLAMARPQPRRFVSALGRPCRPDFLHRCTRRCRPGPPEAAVDPGTLPHEEELHRRPA